MSDEDVKLEEELSKLLRDANGYHKDAVQQNDEYNSKTSIAYSQLALYKQNEALFLQNIKIMSLLEKIADKKENEEEGK